MLNNHCNNPRTLLRALAARNFLSRITLALTTTLLLSQPALAQQPATEVFLLINERLGIMEDVALYKAENNLPVEDLARELIVVENAILAAESAGLASTLR